MQICAAACMASARRLPSCSWRSYFGVGSTPEKSSLLSVQAGIIRDLLRFVLAGGMHHFPRGIHNSDAKWEVLSTDAVHCSSHHCPAQHLHRAHKKHVFPAWKLLFFQYTAKIRNVWIVIVESSCLLIHFHAKTTRFPPVFFCFVLVSLFQDTKMFL